MQHGPDTPSKTPDSPLSEPVSTAKNEPEVQSPTEQSQPSESGEVTLDSGSESFFQTWANNQDTPLGPSLLFLAGVLLALIIIMRSLMKSSAKRKQQTRMMSQPTGRIESINDRAKGNMDPARQIMVEAEDLTRRMGAVLDSKATKIEILLEEANERISQLEHANSETPSPTQHHSGEQVERNEVCPEILDRARLDQDREDRTWGPHTESEPASKVPSFRIDRGLHPKTQKESPHPLTFPEQVDELATKGLNALEIANKLNRLVGEVELVLNLRRNSG